MILTTLFKLILLTHSLLNIESFKNYKLYSKFQKKAILQVNQLQYDNKVVNNPVVINQNQINETNLDIDKELLNTRYIQLKEIFHKIPVNKLKSIVLNSMILLSMREEDFQIALKNIKEVYPFIDPSYILSFKSVGFELLLVSLSEEYNLFDSRLAVQNIVGSNNIADFIRLVPYVLNSKYNEILQNHMRDLLFYFKGMKRDTAIEIIKKWPLILNIRNITETIDKFQNFLVEHDIIISLRDLRYIIYHTPQVLDLIKTFKRIVYLKNKYPFNLSKVIVGYPNILVRTTASIAKHYKNFHDQFGYDYDVEEVINNHPIFLAYNATTLKANLYEINNELNSIYPKYIIESIPRILTSYNKHDIITRIRHTRSLFIGTPSLPSDEIELSREDSLRIVHEYKLLQEQNISISLSDLIVSMQKGSDTSRFQDVDINQKVDVCRLIVGNIGLFLDAFPYFVRLVNKYINEMDSILAYTVLDAVPYQLQKKPTKSIDILKFLYSKIAQKHFRYSIIINQSENNSEMDISSLYQPPNIYNRGKTYDNLYVILRDAPKLLTSDLNTLYIRINQLYHLFDAKDSDYLPILSAPRLLTENSFKRVYYRKSLLDYYIKRNIIQSENGIKYFIYCYPNILTNPLPMIHTRVPFTHRLINRPISFSECNIICHSNTNEYINYLIEVTQLSSFILSSLYSNELVDVIRKLSSSETNSKIIDVLSSDCNELEKHLCGLLNDIADNK